MKTYIIDANAILRFYLVDNIEQANRVKKVLEEGKFGTSKLILPLQVIFEIEYALNRIYKIPIPGRSQFLKNLISTPYINIEDISSKTVLTQVLELFKDNKISLVDALLITIAKDHKAEILTFDKELLKVYKLQKI